MALLIGSLFALLIGAGFGISTNIYQDMFKVTKKANDGISLFVGIAVMAFILYLGFVTN
jgi:hypothetical protein